MSQIRAGNVLSSHQNGGEWSPLFSMQHAVIIYKYMTPRAPFFLLPTFVANSFKSSRNSKKQVRPKEYSMSAPYVSTFILLLSHAEADMLLWCWRRRSVSMFPHSCRSCCFRWPPWNYGPAGRLISSRHSYTHLQLPHTVADLGARKEK